MRLGVCFVGVASASTNHASFLNWQVRFPDSRALNRALSRVLPIGPRRRRYGPTALREIDVRTAAVDEVPKVAAALADALMNDPVFTFLRPGRLRQRARLRTMFVVEIEQYVLANGGTVWTTSGYDGAVAELPPGAWEMPKSATGKETLKWLWAFRTRLPRAISVQRAMAERHPRASLLRPNGRGAHRSPGTGRGIDRRHDAVGRSSPCGGASPG